MRQNSGSVSEISEVNCARIVKLQSPGCSKPQPGLFYFAQCIENNQRLVLKITESSAEAATHLWDESCGWGIVNAVQDYVIFMDGTRLILAEAMNLRAMVPAYVMGTPLLPSPYLTRI